METGIFDFPAPFFSLIDGVLAGFLPDTFRLILWGVAAGVASMGLYWLTSPQERLEKAKTDSIVARKALSAYDGDFDGIFPLMLNSLSASFRHLGLALGPALLGSLPVIFLMVWMSNSYGYRLPEPGAEVTITAVGESAPLNWPVEARPNGEYSRTIAWPAQGQKLEVSDPSGEPLLSLPLAQPVPVKHKRVWWNMLFANPLGSLPEDAAADALRIGLSPKEFLSIGPAWMRGWEAPFILVVLFASVGVKIAFRIR